MAVKRRVGVAGLGSIGRRHTRLLLERDDVVVEAAEPQAESRAAVERDFGIRTHATFEDMLDTRPDVIWIATPTSSHAELAIAALDGGAHVFCEKPLSDSVESGIRMRTAAERASTVFNVGFYLHFWHGMVRIRQLIAEGRLGRVLHAHARVGSYTTLVNSVSRYQTEQFGSLLLDYAHQPDLFYWLLDASPSWVWAAGIAGGDLELMSRPNVVDVICGYESQTITSVHLNYVQLPERHTYEIVGDRGWATTDFFAGVLRYGSRESGQTHEETFVQERDDIFRAEHRAFFEAIDGRRPPETSAADALVSTAVCEAAMESMRSGARTPVRRIPG